MATINLGAIKFNWKGAYNSSTTYAVDDVVSSGGNSYVCIQAHSNQAVGNATAYWNIMSSAGTNGTNGTNGSAGDTFGLANKEIAFKTNAGALDGIPMGTAGQFLKVNSGATGYEYGAVSSDFVKLNESTAGASTHSIDGFFTSDYDNYVLIGNNIQPNTNTHLNMRFQIGGSEHNSSEYVYASGMSYTDASPTLLWTTAGSAYSDWDAPDNVVNIQADSHNSTATHVGQLKVNIYNPLGTTNWKIFDIDWKYNYANNWNRIFTGGMLKNTSAISGIRFYYDSGTISGSFKLYGIK